MGAVDYDARYRIANLEPGEWRVRAALGGGGRQAEGRVRLPADAEEAVLDLDFGGGLTLSGRVLRGGAPFGGAVVGVNGTDVSARGDTTTDRGGAFRIEGLEPGNYELRVVDFGAGTDHREGLVLDGDREITVEISTAAIAGRVLDDADGRPLVAALVTLSLVSEGAAPSYFGGRGTSTDSRGQFRLAGVAAGEWRVRAEVEGYAAGEQTVSLAEEDLEEMEFRLSPTAGLVLEVGLAGGEPPPSVRLAVLNPAGAPILGGYYATGENGRVRLKTVAAGSFEVLVGAPGAETLRLPALVPGPTIAVLLQPGARLKVEVPELAAESVLARLQVADSTGRPFALPEWGGMVRSEWRMHAGTMTLEGLPAGSFVVSVTAPDGRSWSGPATLSSGSETVVRLE